VHTDFPSITLLLEQKLLHSASSMSGRLALLLSGELHAAVSSDRRSVDGRFGQLIIFTFQGSADFPGKTRLSSRTCPANPCVSPANITMTARGQHLILTIVKPRQIVLKARIFVAPPTNLTSSDGPEHQEIMTDIGLVASPI
jgi:hypothetical protein